jgi:hypothetical protein
LPSGRSRIARADAFDVADNQLNDVPETFRVVFPARSGLD